MCSIIIKQQNILAMTINEFKKQLSEEKVPGYSQNIVEMNGESFPTYSTADFIGRIASYKKIIGRTKEKQCCLMIKNK